MELPEAKEILKSESKYNESLNKTTNELLENKSYASNFEIDIHRRTKVNQAIDTVLKALEDSIPKEKVREKIKERENKRDNAEMTLGSALFERDINLLEELLGE